MDHDVEGGDINTCDGGNKYQNQVGDKEDHQTDDGIGQGFFGSLNRFWVASTGYVFKSGRDKKDKKNNGRKTEGVRHDVLEQTPQVFYGSYVSGRWCADYGHTKQILN